MTSLSVWTTDENQGWSCEYLTEFASDFGPRYVAEELCCVRLDRFVCGLVGVVTPDFAQGWSSPRLSMSGCGVRLCVGASR